MREYRTSVSEWVFEGVEDSHDKPDQDAFTVWHLDRITEVIQVIGQGYKPRNIFRKPGTIAIRTLDKYPE